MSARSRSIAASVLAVLAVVALLAAALSGYFAHAILDADQFSDRAASALASDAVSEELGSEVADELVSGNPDLIAVRPVIEQVIAGAVRTRAFQDVFGAAVRDLHRSLFERDANTVALTLADIGATARGVLEAFNPKLARQIPGAEDAEVLSAELPAVVEAAVEAADGFRALPWVLLALAILLGGAGYWLSHDRRRTVIVLGVSTMVAAVVAVVGLRVIEVVVLERLEPGQSRDAVGAIWSAFFGDLRIGLLLLAAAGAVVTAAASSLLRPLDLFAPLERGAQLLARVPESRRGRVVRGLALVAVGVLIVVRHEAFVELVAILVGLYVAYAGASELMRLTVPDAPGEAEAARGGRAALVTATITAGLILVAGLIFVRAGGAEEDPLAIETVGCNGSEALCEATVDEVTFPATHNSMSAATNPDWLFAQQEDGFPAQLREGVRGLLIDAHYGQPTESGVVETDLSGVSGGERNKLEREIGTEAFEAALRLRDQVVNSPPSGDRGVYLCHGFCELGALPIDKGLAQIRDFLAANPDEVLVIVIEDYVEPTEIADAVERTGLIDYVYTGELGPPWPTLGEMARSGERVLIFAENDAGGGTIPWYHLAYDRAMQETPYSYGSPDELTDERTLARTCEPNRGPADASLFLINHWVDTSPAPKPSNARKVNAKPALLRRVDLCESERDLVANLIAVDFYREGDLFEVAAKLNDATASSP